MFSQKLKSSLKLFKILIQQQFLTSKLLPNTQINLFLKTYIDFTQTNTIYFNYIRYLKNFYDCILLLLKIKQQNLNILYIHTQITKDMYYENLLLKYLKTTSFYYYCGSNWINGFISSKLYLQTTNTEKFLLKNIVFFCPKKPHFAIICLTELNKNIITELRAVGIPVIGIGVNQLSDPRISYFLPVNTLNSKQIFFWIKLFNSNL